jgi:uncharacterized protein
MTKPFAVITGASSGIGFELAKQFADHDFDVLITAEDAQLDAARGELVGRGADVQTVRADLRRTDGVETLYEAIRGAGRDVDALALNAGVGEGMAFVEQDLDDILSIVRLNVASTVHLARLVLADMVARDAGRMLFTSSIASMMPGPYQTVYNASKSFVQSFAQGLQAELAHTKVTVTSLMPGPTETEFFERADMADNTMIGRGSKDDAAKVAAQGYEALMAGKRRVVGGGLNTRAQYVANIVMPDRVKAVMHSLMAKPKKPAA